MATAPWPMWLYRDAQARLFAEGEDIPPGWRDTPHDPLDHDHDGRKGGSRKGAGATARKKKG